VSIYEDLGRDDGIATAVDDFYDRVTGDASLAHHFAGVDMDRLRRHQTALLVQVTGGPAQYTGRTLELAHRRLGVTDAEFDRVVEHLGHTLSQFGVEPATVAEVAGALSAHRAEIVTNVEMAGS